jgi:hypothetical protein
VKVSGFTFIRNAIRYDYPVVEAIRSILPLCDNFVVALGNSDDGTRELISSIDPTKIRIIDSIWDDTLREGGRVLALETDKAYRAIDSDCDWAFYIQGDEVVHEKYLDTIRESMLKWKDHPEVDGLLFNYLHFYGSYDYIGSSDKWYRHEIRVVRKNDLIWSYRDAQGFRKGENDKLRVKPVDAYVYHYGWAKEPRAMQRKQVTFHKLWHSDHWVAQNVGQAEQFDYSGIDAVELFQGTHPAVMLDRIAKKNWKFDFDIAFSNLRLKDRCKRFLRKYCGIDLGYKNYIKI